MRQNSRRPSGKVSVRWEKTDAPIRITLPAELVEWEPDKGDPKLPEIPPPSASQTHITLIPYGCARYRIAMFPYPETDRPD